MFDRNKYKSSIGFTDMLFNILVGFAFLFIVAFLLIKPEAKKEDFERKAEFVVVMEWDHEAPDDIDLYVQDPTQTKVHFRLPITNFMYLDKDDLGYANDIVKNVDVSNAMTLQQALSDMATGMSTALWTTLVGLVCSLIIKVQLVNLEVALNE